MSASSVNLFTPALYQTLSVFPIIDRCSCVQFGPDDITTYAHLLNVALNFKLCHGMIKDALIIGKIIE